VRKLIYRGKSDFHDVPKYRVGFRDAPNSIAPNSIAPNFIAPNSIAPNSIAPNSVIPTDMQEIEAAAAS
jgi:hypothetical protein